MQVVPIINVETLEEVQERLNLVEPFVDWAQIDISDGTFNEVLVWNNPKELKQIKTALNIEVHLMVSDLENKVEKWTEDPVKRIIFQLEASKDPHLVIKKCKDAEKEVGVSIGPDTSWTQLMPFYDKVDLLQILSVRPGPSGQSFIEDSLQKIQDLRENCPNATIEVDGGINKEIAKRCKEAGADIVSAASYIYKSKDIGRVIRELENI
ncbi:MAG: ribulose-phosphate 3-epimerase [Patescibacteria group bacterium]